MRKVSRFLWSSKKLPSLSHIDIKTSMNGKISKTKFKLKSRKLTSERFATTQGLGL
jgi:hypothetical protein